VALSLVAALAAPATVRAQGGLGGDMSGPIDIQANEQEFSGDQVIARGNVHVKYKDSTIIAPAATLFRDAGGNPQKAIFTGHPKLVQGGSIIDADTLTFEIAIQKIIAEGRAHSEVISNSSSSTPDKPANARSGETAAAPERIITDSDRQEYDKQAQRFDAAGHVKVIHGDITVHADKLKLVYGTDSKPETAIFTGNVTANQNDNNTQADTITYSLTTRRLQATGHVKSKVIQQKADGSKKGGLSEQPGADKAAAQPQTAEADGSAQDDTMIILSDSQDYSQETGRVAADGNVRLYYQDTIGIGPKVIMVRNQDGKPERVIFRGRSQVTQPGRRWIADRITLTVADKKVLAEGNTKALILKNPNQEQQAKPDSGQSQLAGRPSRISSTTSEALQ